MKNFSFSFWTDSMILIVIKEYRNLEKSGAAISEWERKRFRALLVEADRRKLNV